MILRIRSYPTESKCDVWLVEKKGDAEQSLMHGAVFPDVAELIAEALKLKVEREERPTVGEMVEKCKELF